MHYSFNIIIITLSSILCSCNSNDETSLKYSASQLYDSAKKSLATGEELESSYKLLYQTIEVDSNYFRAYETAYLIQGVLVKSNINIGIFSLRQMIRLKPDSPDLHLKLGIAYLIEGDTIKAKDLFSNANSLYDKNISKKQISDEYHEKLVANKGYNLILLGNEDEGKKILQSLYDTSNNSLLKSILQNFISKSPDEIKSTATWKTR